MHIVNLQSSFLRIGLTRWRCACVWRFEAIPDSIFSHRATGVWDVEDVLGAEFTLVLCIFIDSVRFSVRKICMDMHIRGIRGLVLWGACWTAVIAQLDMSTRQE